MVFSNAVFLFLFLPITLLVYYSPLCRKMRVRNIWLLIVSLGFYAWGEPVYILLMMASVCVNWYLGRRVSTVPKSDKGKRIVAIACIYNLGMLFVFKYLVWLLESFHLLSEGSALASLTLPIGISFYSFQALSYVIDVYRGQEEAQKNILDVGLYIAFFPQLIAGPIVRYGTIAAQLKERQHSFDLFSAGAWHFVIGLSKKLLLANHLAVLAKMAFRRAPGELSVALAWAGALAFMLQIYFDFSGYSDMAIGLGKMFGFEFLENFNYPYISRSISEYWRRWHISLGEWFRDYLYYPLALGPAVKVRKAAAKRFGRKRAAVISSAFILLAVWMATGIWHGANWTFVVWGLIQFVFIFWEQRRKPLKNKKLGAALGFVGTFLVVLATKVIFNADSMSHAIRYYGSMLHLNGNAWADTYGLYWIGQYKIILAVGFVLAFPVLETIGKFCEKGRLCKVWGGIQVLGACALLALDICYAVGGGYNPFIYFNF
ncbi:MAG: MBOAT family protein [Clostridium sp.]|nr:MBOAT family protein [Acetatifactor muris]MCM1527307.1 hypothetical protein [Bacteroides sp.]MCM1563586.1 MBOAT family protein [Clostridium sp.]